MIRNQAILSNLLRTAVDLYLFLQILAPIPLIGLFWFSTGLALGCDTPPPQPWLFYALLIYLLFSSAVLFYRLSSRAIFGTRRYFFLFLAMANATICSIPVFHFYRAYMIWQSWLYFGTPFLMNTLILFVVLSRRLYAYIYPPKQ